MRIHRSTALAAAAAVAVRRAEFLRARGAVFARALHHRGSSSVAHAVSPTPDLVTGDTASTARVGNARAMVSCVVVTVGAESGAEKQVNKERYANEQPS